MTADTVAAVLALVQSQGTEEIVADLPMPPNGASDGAQALWYALLGAFEFHIGELAILEQLVQTRTHMDEVEADWRREGSPMTASGSMGQQVTDSRIQELRQLRSQFAALIKALSLPPNDGSGKPRPGRPTRADSKPGAKWGSR